MQRTLDLALDLNCEFANFYSAMAYPGSPLYEVAIRRGWRLPDTWSGYSQHSVDTLPLPTRHISAGEVLRFRDRAFDTYFRHEPYLRMVEEKFGEDTLAHIREMTSHTLERKHTITKRKGEKRIISRRPVKVSIRSSFFGFRYPSFGSITSSPPMYGRSTSGTRTEPSFC